MRIVDLRQILDACMCCADEMRTTAMDREANLDDEDRGNLLVLARLVRRSARSRLAPSSSACESDSTLPNGGVALNSWDEIVVAA